MSTCLHTLLIVSRDRNVYIHYMTDLRCIDCTFQETDVISRYLRDTPIGDCLWIHVHSGHQPMPVMTRASPRTPDRFPGLRRVLGSPAPRPLAPCHSVACSLGVTHQTRRARRSSAGTHHRPRS